MRRVGALGHGLVLARGLPELLAGLRHVQDVVHDLEREADLPRVRPELLHLYIMVHHIMVHH